MQRTKIFAMRRDAERTGLDALQRIYRRDDFQNGQLVRRARRLEAAASPALRPQQPGVRKQAQNFGKVVSGTCESSAISCAVSASRLLVASATIARRAYSAVWESISATIRYLDRFIQISPEPRMRMANAFRQHSGGHTPAPNWPTFLTFASLYLKAP